MKWDRSRDPDKYADVWLGGFERNSEASVFKNWRVEDFETPSGPNTNGTDQTPDFLFGSDLGFAVDPSLLLRGWIVDKAVYVDAEAYKVGCPIDGTPERP
jgi:phage terminase large subunit